MPNILRGAIYKKRIIFRYCDDVSLSLFKRWKKKRLKLFTKKNMTFHFKEITWVIQFNAIFKFIYTFYKTEFIARFSDFWIILLLVNHQKCNFEMFLGFDGRTIKNNRKKFWMLNYIKIENKLLWTPQFNTEYHFNTDWCLYD